MAGSSVQVPPTGVRLVTKDLDEMVHMVTQLFGRHTLLSSGPAGVERSIKANAVGTLLVGELQWGSSYRCEVREPSKHLTLTGPRQCGGRIDGIDFEPGEIVAFQPGWCGRLELSAPGDAWNTFV